MDSISPADYELAVLEMIRLDFAGVAVRVFGTENGRKHHVRGRRSSVNRQLDVAVYRLNEDRPFFIADAKRHRRPLDVTDVDTFIGFMDDVGAEIGLLVAPECPSPAANKRADGADVRVQIMTVQQALTYRWLPVAQEIYPYDWHFTEKLAHTVRLLHEDGDPLAIVDSLEGIAFEEWDALIEFSLAVHPKKAEKLLVVIARHHYDDGWRFNAIRHLDASGYLDPQFRDKLSGKERDSDILDLLRAEGDWAV